MTAADAFRSRSTNLRAVSCSDAEFLRDMQRRCYQYFMEACDPETGLVADRAATDGTRSSAHSSTAACGFALAAHCIAAEHQWRPRDEIIGSVDNLLRTLLTRAEHERGFVYHFLNSGDGSRALDSEASTIDTALLIAGAMTAETAFADHPSIVDAARDLYRRVEWIWMLGDNDCFHMGWTPEAGMIAHQWDSFSELILLVLIAIGAPEHAVPPACWHAWRREPVLTFQGQSFLSYPPLFVHQYPLAFFDFRDYRSPNGRSYWENATRAHRAQLHFLQQLASRHGADFSHYGDDLWGITSSDSREGYRDWGGPYDDGRYEPDRGIDGTVVPSAAAGGLPLVFDQAIQTLHFQHDRFGNTIYDRYGFTNAFHPQSGWVNPDVIGIDTGISLLMAENLLTGNVWKFFMQHPAATRALNLAGFTQQGFVP